MKMNPLQLQVFSHFRDRMLEEQKKIERAQTEAQQSNEEYPELIQRITENELTLRKVQSMEEETGLYKLIGPGLFPMRKEEVTTEVNGRLELMKTRARTVESAMKQRNELIKNAQEKLINIDNEFKIAMQKTA